MQRWSSLPVVSQREISDVATSGSVIIGSSSEILLSDVLGKIAPVGIFCKTVHINNM